MKIPTSRPADWIGSSRQDLVRFPKRVREEIGYALFLLQHGGMPPAAKRMKGVGSGVIEIIENWSGDTYRAVCLVRFEDRIYVLHCFQKKSKQGIKTPKPDMELIKTRLKIAEEDHRNLSRTA